MDIGIIGAGPAGFSAAIQSAAAGGKVTIFEKKATPGRKLLLSGSGQCNLTHAGSIQDFLTHYGHSQERFLKSPLYAFDNCWLKSLFVSQGIDLVDNGKGKIFPRSGKAVEILHVLKRRIAKLNVNLKCKSPVDSLTIDGDRFLINADGKTMSFDRVIIACGGMSYPVTGSTGDGYNLAKKLGHSIVAPRPALTAVRIQDFSLSGLSGVSFEDIEISLFRNGKKQMHTFGDLVITHKGFSGPGVLNLSRTIEKGDVLKIDFSRNGEEFIPRLLNEASIHPKIQLNTLFRRLGIPASLVEWGIENSGLVSSAKAGETGKKLLKKIAKQFWNHEFVVSSLEGYETAMVTAGGINRKEINPKTMESRLVPGLFFAGEVIDIDGDTGGYNLQAAFSTGALAGRSAVEF